MISGCDLRYIWCFDNLKRQYADGVSKSFRNYNNASSCFSSVIIVFKLVKQLWFHTKHSVDD